MVSLPSPRHRWTRAEYYKIIDAGCFRPDAHLELVQGDIIEKELPMNSPHATGVRRGENALRSVFEGNFVVTAQLPLTLSDMDEPLPDLAVSVGSPDDFEEKHPDTAVLIVEVPEATLPYDRTVKEELYARSGIVDFWILNLVERKLEVYRDPDGAHYRSIQIFDELQAIAPLAAPDRPISVTSLLPRPKAE